MSSDGTIGDKTWDVVIVGGGPAGATAALHLARAGVDVLLLDKFDFPREKVCGDCLISDSLNSLKRSGVLEDVAKRGRTLNILTIYSQSGTKIEIPGEFVTLARKDLDSIIMDSAIAHGALFRRIDIVSCLETGDSVQLAARGDGRKIRARFALLATGANITLQKQLGLPADSRPGAVALRCYLKSEETLDKLIVSYDRSIAPGYAWIFPMKNCLFNIGCGFFFRSDKAEKVNLKSMFSSFVEHFPEAKTLWKSRIETSPLRGAPLRCGLRSGGFRSGRFLSIGESISTTYPFTGEGIGKAMESGEIAAEVMIGALKADGPEGLDLFAERIDKELRPKYYGYDVAERWLSARMLNDFVARRANRSRFLADSLAGIIREEIDPKVVFSASGILKSFLC